MANPFPFVAGNVLTAAQLNGIGEWTSYTPVLTATTTNPTYGTGATATGSYARVQNLIIYQFNIYFGTPGFVAGVGNYFVSLPITAFEASQFYGATVGRTSFYDSSANTVYYADAWIGTTTKLNLTYVTATNGAIAPITATTPVIPASGDAISGLVIYKAA
jgi:hypothetical protein